MSNKDYNKIQAKNNMEVGKAGETGVDSADSKGEAERPKLQSVVVATPKKAKRSLLSRLVTSLVGPDGASNIGGYVSEEIIKPAVKNIIFDALTSGVSMILFGDRGMPNRGRYPYAGDNRPRTAYNNAYAQPRPNPERAYGREPAYEPPRNNVVSSVRGYGVDEYIIPERYDAAHVLTSLTEYAARYNFVSVADYYDLIKVESRFTDNNYGWRHDAIIHARIVPERGGYVIKFPPVEATR